MNKNPLMLNKKFWEDVKKALLTQDRFEELGKVVDEGFSDLAKHFESSFSGAEMPHSGKNDPRICPECDYSNPTNARYCNQCGTELGSTEIGWPLNEQPPWDDINELLGEYGIKFLIRRNGENHLQLIQEEQL